MINHPRILSLTGLDTLLHQLQYQYPVGIHTSGACPMCGKPARGSAICRFCIAEEIKRRPGVDPVAVDQLMNARAQAVHVLMQIDKLQDGIKGARSNA